MDGCKRFPASRWPGFADAGWHPLCAPCLTRAEYFTAEKNVQLFMGSVGFLRSLGLVLASDSGDSFAMEIVFSVTQENDGGYVAECLSYDIFTQGDTWDELRANVREAVSAYFFDQAKPDAIRLHLVRDELLAGK
jgi:predicted RNase H-like HicB family nuclease